MSSAPPPSLINVPDEHRATLELMAVVHEPLYADALSSWWHRLHAHAVTSEDWPRDRGDARTALESLQRSGHLVSASSHTQAYRVLPSLQHELLELLRQEKRLAKLSAFVRAEAPLHDPGNSYGGPARLGREVLHAVYLGERIDVLALVRSSALSTRWVLTASDVLLDALGPTPPAYALEGVGVPAAEAYLTEAVKSMAAAVQPMPASVLEYVQAQKDSLKSPVLALLSAQLTFEGRFAEALALCGEREDAHVYEARALTALAQGKFEEGRRLAALAMEHTRDKQGRHRGLRSTLGPFSTLLLVTSRDATEARLAGVQLELVTRSKVPSDVDELYRPLTRFAEFLDGTPYLASENLPESMGWCYVLLSALVARLAGAPRYDKMLPTLTRFRTLAEERGFKWVVQAFSELMNRPSSSGQLGALYRPEEAWERALSSLDRAVEELKLKTPAKDEGQRLVFVLALSERGSPHLSGRIQTRRGRVFSAGKVVSLSSVALSLHGEPWIDAADRRVLAHVDVEESSSFNGPSRSELDSRAMLALVGHPRVFMGDDLKRPIEIVLGTPRIDVRERQGSLIVTLAPDVCANAESSVACERDGPGRVVVYVLNDAQRRLAERLSRSGLRIPTDGHDRAKKVLGKLVDHFPVTSDVDLDAVHLEEVPPDPTLNVLLWRRGAGLRARVVVRPLGTGPSFAPGEGSASVLGTREAHGGAQVRTTRNLEEEQAAFERLCDSCPTLDTAPTEDRDRVLLDTLSCLELLTELYRVRDEYVVSWPEGEPLSIAGEADVHHLRMVVRSQGEWLSAQGEAVVDGGLKISLRELLALAQKAQGRFLVLDDGRFVALTERLKKHLDGLLVLADLRSDSVRLHALAAIDLSSWLGELGRFEGDPAVSQRLAAIAEAGDLAPVVPTELQADLRPYQRDGYAWLMRLAHWGAGACLADDMGLGKTLQTLAFLLSQGEHGPALVIAPLSVCSNWMDEAERFAPKLRMRKLAGADRSALLETLGPYDVVVTSYGLLQQDIERLEQVRFRVLVLDEAQAIKNASAQRTQAALRLVGDLRVALTGTPVENHLGELWSIMTFLNPGLLGTARSFEERFARPIQRDGDTEAAALLQRLIQPFVLRRRKSEVLASLPEKTVITQRIPPSEAERALYAALREQALEKLTDRSKPAETRMRLLAELMRLRRAACHPSLVAPEAGIASSKLATFEALLNELREGGHRALVFSQFVDYLSIVRKRLEELGVTYQYLDGSSSAVQREKAVRNFQAGEGDVFLISLKAGGFGLNLTAADYVFHLDPWWNPAVEDQASDRAHRIGQLRPVTIYRLVMEDSIEEKILDLHAHKRDLADQLLEGTSSAAPINLDDLMGLLREAGVAETKPARASRTLGGVV